MQDSSLIYYIVQNNEAKGPYTLGQLRAMWNSGVVTGETPYCKEGWPEWLPLRGMIRELEQPVSPAEPPAVPPKIAPSRRRKHNVAIAIGFGCLGLIAVTTLLGITLRLWSPADQRQEAITSPTQEQELMATPKYGLPPITLKLQGALIDALNQTDALDAMVKRSCTFNEYASVFAPIEQSAEKLQDALPSTDPRIYIFLSAMERYQALALKLSRNEPKKEIDDADLFASLPKALLLQVLNGTLDENGQRMFKDIKEQIQSGKM
jgi:hypothetical protein